MSAFGPPDQRQPEFQSRLRRMLWVLLGMVYLAIWPLAGIFRHGRSTTQIAVELLALLSFVVAFLALVAVNRPDQPETRRTAWYLLAALTAMAVAYPLLLGGDWAGLGIYLSVAYAMALPVQWARRGVLAATALMAVLCGALLRAPGSTTALLTVETLTIGMLMLGFRGNRILIVRLQEARDEVARLAANEERLRIARDLHDLLGHTLSLIVLKSEVAVRLAGRDPARSLGEVRDIETVARRALTDVREAITGYRRRSLAEELDGARETLAAAGVEATLTISGTPLPDALDGLFGWAVREGATNVVRHADARTAAIAVARQGGTAVLEITDDGRGPGARPSGNGLAGLAERVAAAGGTADFGAAAGGGFRLTVRVPLSATGGTTAARSAAMERPAPHPTTAEPAATEPAATEPAATKPAATKPAATEPAALEPARTEPAGTEPAGTEPAGTEPAGTEPAGVEPASGAEGAGRAEAARRAVRGGRR